MCTPYTGSKNVCFETERFLDRLVCILKAKDIKISFEPKLEQDMLTVLNGFILFSNLALNKRLPFLTAKATHINVN